MIYWKKNGNVWLCDYYLSALFVVIAIFLVMTQVIEFTQKVNNALVTHGNRVIF